MSLQMSAYHFVFLKLVSFFSNLSEKIKSVYIDLKVKFY